MRGRNIRNVVINLTEDPGDLFDETVGSDESIVTLGQLLDEFLVLVQFLKIIYTLKEETVRSDRKEKL